MLQNKTVLLPDVRTGIQQSAINTIEKEPNAVAGLKAFINDAFEEAVTIIHSCRGRVVLSGIGKSAIVAPTSCTPVQIVMSDALAA